MVSPRGNGRHNHGSCVRLTHPPNNPCWAVTAKCPSTGRGRVGLHRKQWWCVRAVWQTGLGQGRGGLEPKRVLVSPPPSRSLHSAPNPVPPRGENRAAAAAASAMGVLIYRLPLTVDRRTLGRCMDRRSDVVAWTVVLRSLIRRTPVETRTNIRMDCRHRKKTLLIHRGENVVFTAPPFPPASQQCPTPRPPSPAAAASTLPPPRTFARRGAVERGDGPMRGLVAAPRTARRRSLPP
eukprot:gene10941-biopygen7806